ncbi:hypothetical protein LEMLEM_LOCUS25469 [Lemmus lemmus]
MLRSRHLHGSTQPSIPSRPEDQESCLRFCLLSPPLHPQWLQKPPQWKHPSTCCLNLTSSTAEL